MSIRLIVEPLTQENFRPFGTVIFPDPLRAKFINGGTTTRFDRLGECEALGADAQVIISIFRGQPRQFPYQIGMMERHPLGSQSFSPLSDRPFLVVVAHDYNGAPTKPQVFRAEAGQGVNYCANVWHHPLMALGAVSDFLVVDRSGSGNNLEECDYPVPFTIEEVSI